MLYRRPSEPALSGANGSARHRNSKCRPKVFVAKTSFTQGARTSFTLHVLVLGAVEPVGSPEGDRRVPLPGGGLIPPRATTNGRVQMRHWCVSRMYIYR